MQMSERDQAKDPEAQWKALMSPDDEGGSETSYVQRRPEIGVTVVLSDAEKAEIARRNQIGADLDLVLAPVPKEIRSDAKKNDEYRSRLSEAKKRLEEQNINLDTYLRDGYNVHTTEGLATLGKRKSEVRVILNKMRKGEELTLEEKEIADKVGLNETVIVVKKEEEVVVPVPRPPEITAPARTEATRSNSEIILENNLNTLANNHRLSFKERRSAIEARRESMIRSPRAVSEGELRIVENALLDLTAKENEEISRYEAAGMMRPEVAAVLAKFNEDLRKAYEGSGILINTLTNTLQEGQLKISLEDLRSRGSDGRALAERLEREVLSIAILHDLRMKVDRNSPVTEMMDLAAQLNGTNFNNLLHLEDRTPEKRNDPGGNDYVLRCLVAIDEEARTVYRDGTGKRAFSLQDPTLKARIMNITGGSELYYSIARDLYRVTGGEARYSVASYAHQDPARNGAWVIERVEDGGGTVFRKALNGRREAYGLIRKDPPYYTTYNPLLLSHMDPAVMSFWEGLWSKAKKEPGANVSVFGTQKETVLNTDAVNGIPTREYAVLSLEALRNLRLGDNTEFGYKGWLENMGNNAESMGKEIKFMTNPSFKAFQATFGEEYKYAPRLRNGIPLERNQYFLERLADYVQYSLSIGMSPSAISAELDTYRGATYLFSNDEELNKFKEDYDIPTSYAKSRASDARVFWRMLFSGGSEGKKSWGLLGDILLRIAGFGGGK